MIRFRMLGTLDLRDPKGRELHAVLRRPKLLALLAYLAIARPPGFHRRDTLVALLWPELDHSHARNALRQAVHALRDALGRDVFVSRGEEELGVNEERLSCDVRDFETALDSGRPETSLELYRGGLLNGLYVSGAPGFERWLDQEQEHLRRRAIEAAQLLMEREEAAGNPVGAAGWALRLTELSPDDEVAVRRLVRLLDRSGNRAGAVRAYEEFERRLARDLDLQPSSESRALLAEIRGRPRPEPAPSATGATRWDPPVGPGREGLEELSPGATRGERPRAPPRAVPLKRKVAVGVAVVTAAAAALFWRPTNDVPLDANLVAVAPFDVLPPEMEPWREALVDVLSGYLDRAGPLRTVAPTIVRRHWRGGAEPVAAAALGQRTGARYVVFGALLGAGPDSIRLTATLLDVASGQPLVQIEYRDASDQVDRLSDALVVAVLHELGRAQPIAAGPGSHDATLTVSGRVLGPDGRSSICDYLPKGSVVTARLLNAAPPPLFGGFDAFACPENQLRLTAAASGPWYLRVDLPTTLALGSLPQKHFEPDPVEFGVARDIVIREGSALDGRGTFEGKPVEGVDLTLRYDSFGLMATWGRSGTDGRWEEFFGRSPIIVQNELGHSLGEDCRYLGAKVVSTASTAAFESAPGARSVDCTLITAPSIRFTHDLTRLLVTSLPGDIGGQSEDFAREVGYGWSVQFPVGPGESPSHDPFSSELFMGGLVIGIGPDRVLSGVSLRGEGACGARCRDLGLDAEVRVASSPLFGKLVIWRYSDAGSPEGIGLRIVQESFDGRPPADHVLFRFVLTNSGQSRITFHAGFFGDWDIGRDPTDDIGFTEMAGRLMYQTNADPIGPYMGTLLISNAPVSGNFFFRSVTVPSLTEQVDALAGRVSQPTSDEEGDNRYIHGVGPFTLDQGESAELWIAVVAGQTKAELLASAAAARAAIADRPQRVLEEGLASLSPWTPLTSEVTAASVSRGRSRP